MFSLILLVLSALGFGYFATQNTLTLPLTFGAFSTPQLPIYVIVGASLLLGLLIAWLISILSSLATAMILRDRDKEIKDDKETIHTMTKRINELEIENANLKGELHNEPLDDISL